MKKCIQFLFFILLYSFQSYSMAQDSIFPLNYLSDNITSEELSSLMDPVAFDGYYEEKRAMLITKVSDFWKNLQIWHFSEGYGRDAVVCAAFFFDATNRLESVAFSSSNLAEMHFDDRTANMQDYFQEYGTAIITYLQTLSWDTVGSPDSFPFEMKSGTKRMTIRIDTLYDVAINPEVDGITGFHFHYAENHIPHANKYLRFRVIFE